MLQRLARHPLPGNVRELENLLHRAVALNDGEALHLDFAGDVDDAGLEQGQRPPDRAPTTQGAEQASAQITDIDEVDGAAPPHLPPLPRDLQHHLDQQEREILVRALHQSGFNRTAAAARLGLSLRQIRYRIARLAISVPVGDAGAQGSLIDE